MTNILADYNQKSVFDVFERFLKCSFCNTCYSMTNLCFEVSNNSKKLAVYLVFLLNYREKNSMVSGQEIKEATEMDLSFPFTSLEACVLTSAFLYLHSVEELYSVENSCRKGNL